MTKKETILKWRLSEKPTAENILELVKGGIITKEEAKKIILDYSEVSISDIETIKNEISLLRKIVLEISEKSPEQIIRIIEKEIPIYIRQYPKYVPYWDTYNKFYCSNTGNTQGLTGFNGTVNNTTGYKAL